MIKSAARDFRPKLHFTPPSMWINDPNGMVYLDGVFHLFYQYYPENTKWGPMHWGHAISENLLNWEHLPIAIYPDKLGFAFSGCSVYDIKNVSGLGEEGKSPLVVLYTSHNSLDNTETQSIAYSTDFVDFIKYSGNPVISNPGIKDFRDPKVFWNPVYECWSAVIAAGKSVLFFSSDNLIDWKQTGEFSTNDNGITGICECPDCIPFDTIEGLKWILIVSMITGSEDMKDKNWKTQYFIGDFDGNRFINREKSEEALLLNYGFDHYAGVSFQNSDKPILMAWASNWAYANEVPTNSYRGQMSLACEIQLVKTHKGYRLKLQPIVPKPKKSDQISLKSGRFTLKTQTFALMTEVSGKGKIIMNNVIGEQLLIEVNEDEVIVDRSVADKKDFNEAYGKPEFSKVIVKRYTQGSFNLNIIFDVSVLEVFAEDGLIPVTMSTYPTKPYDTLKIEGDLTSTLFHL